MLAGARSPNYLNVIEPQSCPLGQLLGVVEADGGPGKPGPGVVVGLQAGEGRRGTAMVRVKLHQAVASDGQHFPTSPKGAQRIPGETDVAVCACRNG